MLSVLIQISVIIMPVLALITVSALEINTLDLRIDIAFLDMLKVLVGCPWNRNKILGLFFSVQYNHFKDENNWMEDKQPALLWDFCYKGEKHCMMWISVFYSSICFFVDSFKYLDHIGIADAFSVCISYWIDSKSCITYTTSFWGNWL